MLYGLNIADILLSIIIIVGLMAILFNKEFTKSVKCNPIHFRAGILLTFLFLLPGIAIEVGILKFVINFILIIFSLYVFFIGFLIDRKYIYTSAILFLVLAAIMNTMGYDAFAEYMAILCYLLLVMGVIKDIFYEKLFKTN